MNDILACLLGFPLSRHTLSLTPPTDDARETLAAGEVMDMCRNDAALSQRVLHLRDYGSERGPLSWRDVLAVLLEC